MRVLLIDDHPDVCEVVARALTRDGHSASAAFTAREARELASTEQFQLFVVDLGLPDGTGLDFCRWLRASGNHAPVLVLTAQSAVASRVSSLDAGADDHLSKPFAVAELRARVRALGRRASNAAVFIARHRKVELDFSARRATVAGREAPVTAREWALLELLASRGGRMVRRDELLETGWGDIQRASSASLEVLIARIRKKLDPTLVRTIRGEGYAFGGTDALG
jgi:DNA-binding response OmpR family regulator